MMKIPGKSFILGEYAVLQGANPLILTHAPCFEFATYPATQFEFGQIHPRSPAGRYLSDMQNQLAPVRCELINPYGFGGVGASSAEFIGVYDYLNQETPIDNNHLFALYKHYTQTQEGLAPSGADCLAQAHTAIGLQLVNMTTLESHSLSPLPQCYLTLVHTGFKLATHEHLAKLCSQDFSQLSLLTTHALNAWRSGDMPQVCQIINNYYSQLITHDLVCKHTQDLIHTLKQSPDILATKGCGAMGADTLLILSKNPCEPLLEAIGLDTIISVIAPKH